MKVKKPKDKHITVRATLDKYRHMKLVCDKYGITLSDFLNNAIDERLNENILDTLKRLQAEKPAAHK